MHSLLVQTSPEVPAQRPVNSQSGKCFQQQTGTRQPTRVSGTRVKEEKGPRGGGEKGYALSPQDVWRSILLTEGWGMGQGGGTWRVQSSLGVFVWREAAKRRKTSSQLHPRSFRRRKIMLMDLTRYLSRVEAPWGEGCYLVSRPCPGEGTAGDGQESLKSSNGIKGI